jgi:hypothetical protein
VYFIIILLKLCFCQSSDYAYLSFSVCICFVYVFCVIFHDCEVTPGEFNLMVRSVCDRKIFHSPSFQVAALSLTLQLVSHRIMNLSFHF